MSDLTSSVLVAARAELAEGPVWDHANSRLLWVDILQGQVHATTPDGSDQVIWQADCPIGCIAPRGDGTWIVAERDRLTAVTDWSVREELVRLPIDDDVRTNDGRLDPAGRMLVGTMAFDAEPGRGQLFSWDGEALRALIEPVTISNGLGWSPDRATMYYVDSPTQVVAAYDYDLGTGSVANRRVLAEIDRADGTPDGMCVDAGGGLWVALWGGRAVRHLGPDGALLGHVLVDAQNVSSCTFGGRNLYITTARTESPETPNDGAIFVAAAGTVADHPGAPS